MRGGELPDPDPPTKPRNEVSLLMLDHDSAPLRVLDTGGTRTTSASRARLSQACGMQVSTLARGTNRAGRDLPEDVPWLTGAPRPARGAS